jgi:transposase
MNIIYEKTGIIYHEVHVYRLLHKRGDSVLRFQERGSSLEKN